MVKAGPLTGMRCIGCRTETREGDEVCRKCGDRVAPPVARGARLELVEDEPGLKVTTTFERARTAVGTRPAPVDFPPEFPRNVTDVITLTEEQERAIEYIHSWYTSPLPRVFRLFGPAGTGKSTLARSVGPMLGLSDVVFGAYTGKAAHVLRRKGVPATTIHSAVYHPVDNYEVRAEWREATYALAELQEAKIMGGPGEPGPMWHADVERLTAQIEALEATMRRPSFEFNPGSEWADADLIVLDEVSMVNAKMAEDIERFGVPVLVLGDPEQLPPIEGGGHYTAAAPDVLLTEVHRQALESPVYRLATQVREGRGWSTVPVSLAAAMEADQILVWKNSTRWNLIHKIRQKLGRPKEWPVPGDRIQCLVNNKDAGLFNGAQFEVLAAAREGEDWLISVRDDEGHERDLIAYPDGFLGLEAEKLGKSTLRAFRGARGLFTFAQAITAHKSQGSEWDSVYVVDQTHQMWKSSEAEKRAWMYTAVSRASERVTLASTDVR